jgi:hypothetical protein
LAQEIEKNAIEFSQDFLQQHEFMAIKTEATRV